MKFPKIRATKQALLALGNLRHNSALLFSTHHGVHSNCLQGLKVSITVFYLFRAGSLWKRHVQMVLTELQRGGNLKECERCAVWARVYHPTPSTHSAHAADLWPLHLISAEVSVPLQDASHFNMDWSHSAHVLPHFNFLKGNYETTQEYFSTNWPSRALYWSL